MLSNNKAENNGQNEGIIIGNNYGNIKLNVNRIFRIPSLISNLIKTLGDACCKEEYSEIERNKKVYKPNDKLEYNCVLKYKPIIKEYSAYYSLCENYLNAYDDSNIRGKRKILDCVHSWYLEAKGQILLENKGSKNIEIEIIRENSDKIIELVKERIFDCVIESGNINNTCREDIDLGITCFICYCFMECKILEKPL